MINIYVLIIKFKRLEVSSSEVKRKSIKWSQSQA